MSKKHLDLIFFSLFLNWHLSIELLQKKHLHNFTVGSMSNAVLKFIISELVWSKREKKPNVCSTWEPASHHIAHCCPKLSVSLWVTCIAETNVILDNCYREGVY